MGLRCSLFGHDFDEPTVDHDREERGNEVVTTIRETETCRRCGETRIVSETTEVTSLESGGDDEPKPGLSGGDGRRERIDAGGVESADADGKAEDEHAARETAAVDRADDGAEILDADAGGDEGDDAAVESGDEGTDTRIADEGLQPGLGAGGADRTADAPDGDAAGSEDGDEDDADAVILDDERDEPATAETDDEPEDAAPQEPEPAADSVTPPDAPGGVEEDGSRDGRETEAGTATGAGSTAGSDPDAPRTFGPSTALSVPEGEYRCPECGFTTPVDDSSLREGDICPECHKGYLEHER